MSDATTGPGDATELPAPAPRPTPSPSPSPGGGRHAAAEPGRGTSRRWFLGGAGAVVLAAGGGVGAAFLRSQSTDEPEQAPAALLAAVATERALLADLDATTGGAAQVRAAITQVRADHAEHLRALQALAGAYGTASSAASSTAGPSGTSGTPRTAVQLRGAEQRAARQAATRAAGLDGRTATLLASIAACEASHIELLS